MIGAAAVRAAASAGIKVIACTRRVQRELPEGVEKIVANLTDPLEAAKIIRSTAPSHVIHAAWETRHPTYWNDPVNFDWVISTAAMAAAFAEIDGVRFISIGSCAEYQWGDGELMREAPSTRYGKAKIAAFRAVETAAHTAFEAVQARIFWVYGPGENSARFIPSICIAHAAGETPVLGSCRQLRDILYVDDAALALLALLKSSAPTGAVDVGTGIGTPLSAVANRVAALAGRSATGIGMRSDQHDDPLKLISNPELLMSTGWRPKICLDTGLSLTWHWWRRHGQKID